MKRFFCLFLIVLFFLPSLACASFSTRSVTGSGNIIRQTFDVSEFDRVTLEGSGNVYVEQGQTESLVIEADDNIISALDIRVRGHELILGIRRGHDINPSQSITYNLTVKDLRQITLAGSGSFDVDRLEAKELKISMPGSGNIELKGLAGKELFIDLDGSGNIILDQINVKTVDASLRGSGNIQLEGNTKEEKVVIGGSGNYRAGDLQTKSARINIPGSGEVAVWVTKELKIRINGSGDVEYYGNPLIAQSGFGSGNITALGDK